MTQIGSPGPQPRWSAPQRHDTSATLNGEVAPIAAHTTDLMADSLNPPERRLRIIAVIVPNAARTRLELSLFLHRVCHA